MNLFQQITTRQNNNRINELIQMIKGNPNAIFNRVMNSPDFERFKAENYGKTPEQIASEHGIDFQLIQNALNMHI